MIEPLFGSNPQIWQGASSGAGWSHLPVPFGSRVLGGGVTGFSSPQILPMAATPGSIGQQGPQTGGAFPTEAYAPVSPTIRARTATRRPSASQPTV